MHGASTPPEHPPRTLDSPSNTPHATRSSTVRNDPQHSSRRRRCRSAGRVGAPQPSRHFQQRHITPPPLTRMARLAVNASACTSLQVGGRLGSLRRARDSNPRTTVGYVISGFQDRRHRPLGQPSSPSSAAARQRGRTRGPARAILPSQQRDTPRDAKPPAHHCPRRFRHRRPARFASGKRPRPS